MHTIAIVNVVVVDVTIVVDVTRVVVVVVGRPEPKETKAHPYRLQPPNIA